MFISHRTVNPDDVENAAWHFLCVARAEGPEAGRVQIEIAAEDRYASVGGYMHDVARVHLLRR